VAKKTSLQSNAHVVYISIYTSAARPGALASLASISGSLSFSAPSAPYHFAYPNSPTSPNPGIPSLTKPTKFAAPQILTAPSPPPPPIEANAAKASQMSLINPPKNHNQLTNIQIILSHPKSKPPAVSRLIHRPDATKSTTSVASQRFSSARDKIPPLHFNERTRSRAIKLQRQKTQSASRIVGSRRIRICLSPPPTDHCPLPGDNTREQRDKIDKTLRVLSLASNRNPAFSRGARQTNETKLTNFASPCGTPENADKTQTQVDSPRWPATECCVNCRKISPRDRDACLHCGTEFPPPALKGIEIFA
jgi:hypothetical protein